MMNDRFAAQLRQHLLDNADERPADDQLAAVVAGVAVTSQRHPLAARVLNPGRVGAAPSPVVRYGLVALAAIVALGAALVFGGGTDPTLPAPSADPTATVSASDAPEPTVAASPEAPAPGPTVDPAVCLQFDHEAVYTGRAGTLPVGVVVPATTSAPWAGLPDEFDLRNAPCGSDASLWFNASLVAHVFADSCQWEGSSEEAPTVRDVMAKLLTQSGHETVTAPETHIGAFRAQRLDLSMPRVIDLVGCDGGVLALWETPTGVRTIEPGTTVQVYVAEVDGVTLVVTAAYRTEDATPELLGQIDSILGTLRVDM